MHLETSCYLGTTLNPYSLENTPGGSSGGEGALVALQGSAAGVRISRDGFGQASMMIDPDCACKRTDWERYWRELTMPYVGAQLLILSTALKVNLTSAAAYCGLWTLKPTTTRFPIAGSRGTMLGTELMIGVVGPMTRSLRECTIA